MASSNPKSSVSPTAAAEMATQLLARGVNPLSLETILQSVTSTSTDSAVAKDLDMLAEHREDSHSQRLIKKESSIAERSVGKRSRKSAPTSARKSHRTARSSAPLIDEEDESDGSDGESEEVGKGFAQELVLQYEWLVEYNLEGIVELLEAQGWGALFRKAVLVDEKLVKEFYSKLKVVEKEKGKGNLELSAVVGGETFTISMRELATILQVPKGGYATYSKGTWPSSVAKSEVFERLGLDPATKGQREIYSMDVLPRILHRILVSNISPRRHKHNLVTFQDMLLVDQILQKKQVNLAFQVMRHMENNKDNPSNGLPYPGFVKEILTYWEVYHPVSEKMLSYALGDDQIVKLGLVYSAGVGWIVPVIEEEAADDDVVEVSPVEANPVDVAAPVCAKAVLPSGDIGEVLKLVKEIQYELQTAKCELVEVKSEVQLVKQKVVDLELAITVDSGAMSVAVAGFPAQMKDLAAEIVEQMKASFTFDTSS